MKRFLFIFSIISLCFFITNQKASAQLEAIEPADQIIVVDMVPETPRQNEDVSISIDSYAYDLTRSKIAWYINGKLKDSGVGKRNFNFNTGSLGNTSKIQYQIQTPEGVSFSKTITVSPGDVTLLWESLAYTPPFFKGKSLFSYEGKVRLIAIPNLLKANGTKYKSEELVYTWRRGMGTDVDASGYGKNVFYWNGDVISSPEEIQVDVTDVQNTTKATAYITIEPKGTEIFAYENNPALGILWNKAITNNFNLSGSEVSFVATPYYFNNPDSEGIYSWFVNENQSPEISRYITFRNTSGDEGYSQISFDLSSQIRIMQSASSNFDISFGTKNSNPITNIFNGIFGN